MTSPRAVTPLRATMLMDAPEGAVRRALARTDVWTRTARAAGARADVAAPSPSQFIQGPLIEGRATKGPRSPLRAGELIRVRADAGAPAGRAAADKEPAVRGRLWPARSLIFRVELDQQSDESAQRLPVLELIAGPLKSCRISLTTASTGAGTLVTVDCRAESTPAALTPLLRRRILRTEQLLLGIAMLAAREIQIVVAGAIVRNNAVLAARRTDPPELAGRWELPGGKVDPGETEQGALVRELAEELGLAVTVDGRLGSDIDLGDNMVLRCYSGQIEAGEPVPTEHDAVRWIGPGELDSVDWLDSDRSLLPDLRRCLQPELRHR